MLKKIGVCVRAFLAFQVVSICSLFSYKWASIATVSILRGAKGQLEKEHETEM